MLDLFLDVHLYFTLSSEPGGSFVINNPFPLFLVEWQDHGRQQRQRLRVCRYPRQWIEDIMPLDNKSTGIIASISSLIAQFVLHGMQ